MKRGDLVRDRYNNHLRILADGFILLCSCCPSDPLRNTRRPGSWITSLNKVHASAASSQISVERRSDSCSPETYTTMTPNYLSLRESSVVSLTTWRLLLALRGRT